MQDLPIQLRPIDAVYEELQRTPAGRELAAHAQERQPDRLWLVGGAVRDVLLGRHPRELDVLVEGDALAAARALAARLEGTVEDHGEFGTASVTSPGGRIDLAMARRETYPRPGALPLVAPASVAEDLGRRDFTINAIAVGLGQLSGCVEQVPGALADLEAFRLRVLHDHSFEDDPTRLLRLARYDARLTFDPDEHTRLLAARAVRAGALATVSGARVGAELRLALAEPAPLETLAELERLELLAALHPRLRYDRELLARACAIARESDPDQPTELLLLAALCLGFAAPHVPDGAGELRAWLDRLEFPAGDREVVVRSALGADQLATLLKAAERPSQLHAAAASQPLQAVALAGALGAEQPARRWLGELRHVRLAIGGDDLLAAGIPAGPEIGRRLAAALDQRLDGALAPGREAELAAALA